MINKDITMLCKGSHWYNNGVIQTQARECPEGFVPGRLVFRKSDSNRD